MPSDPTPLNETEISWDDALRISREDFDRIEVRRSATPTTRSRQRMRKLHTDYRRRSRRG